MLAIPLRQLVHDHDFAGRTEQLVDKPGRQQLHLQASSVNTVAPKKTRSAAESSIALFDHALRSVETACRRLQMRH